MPKAFQFRLQKVLDLKQQLEELMSVNLKKSQAELEAEKQLADQLDQRKEQAICASGQLEELSLTQIQLAWDYIQQLNRMIDAQNKIVEQRRQQVDDDRAHLLKASQEKKVVEKLREKHQEDYHLSLRKKELTRESEIAQRIVNQKAKEEVWR